MRWQVHCDLKSPFSFVCKQSDEREPIDDPGAVDQRRRAFRVIFFSVFKPTMGLWSSKTSRFRVLVAGLRGSGKSSIVRRINGDAYDDVGDDVTRGFHVASITRDEKTITCVDVGGCGDTLDSYLAGHTDEINALVFVIDISDAKCFSVSASELWRLLRSERLRGIPILLYGNKQDDFDAISVEKIMDGFNLHKIRGRKWHMQACSARTGHGVMEGFDWLVHILFREDSAETKREGEDSGLLAAE